LRDIRRSAASRSMRSRSLSSREMRIFAIRRLRGPRQSSISIYPRQQSQRTPSIGDGTRSARRQGGAGAGDDEQGKGRDLDSHGENDEVDGILVVEQTHRGAARKPEDAEARVE